MVEASGVANGALFRSISKSDRLLAPRLGDRDVARTGRQRPARPDITPPPLAGAPCAAAPSPPPREGHPRADHRHQSGHKSINVLRGYVRRGGLFNENAAALI